MKNNQNIFLNKKILIYGLGKSGVSTFKFLKNKNDIFLYDDFISKDEYSNYKKNFLSYHEILKLEFDKIILSPGIDINKCKLSKFLKNNYKKVHTDLDVFFSFFKNKCITITGTNGKSTTCQLLYEILLKQKFDVKLAGNIGNPILSVNNIKKNSLFIIEASSYQLEYSKIFKSKYAAILNLSPDHIERHKTINNYVKAKFRLLNSQLKGDFAFLKKDDSLIQKKIKSNRYKTKIIKVNPNNSISILKYINNDYFLTETNKENLSFALEISQKFKIKKSLIIKTLQNFRGLKYRQQIIYKKKNLIIINDSKSTSFSSTTGILKTSSNFLWLLGGIPKKGDKFILPQKYCKNIKAFIYGKKKEFFNNQLKNKIRRENFINLKDALKKAFLIVKKNRSKEQTILFSPCAASFDDFKNFEHRGFYFNKLVKKYLNGI